MGRWSKWLGLWKGRRAYRGCKRPLHLKLICTMQRYLQACSMRGSNLRVQQPKSTSSHWEDWCKARCQAKIPLTPVHWQPSELVWQCV